MFNSMLNIRKHHMKALDARTSLLTEVTRHLHSIKLFSYESIFSKRIAALRANEASWVRKVSSMTAASDVIGYCMPSVAAVSE